MNHPAKVVLRARPFLNLGERVFYCRYDSEIVFTASDNVAIDLDKVTFISVYTEIGMSGIIHNDVLADFTPQTHITGQYVFKDFIEIDRDDPAVWED